MITELFFSGLLINAAIPARILKKNEQKLYETRLLKESIKNENKIKYQRINNRREDERGERGTGVEALGPGTEISYEKGKLLWDRPS